MRLVSGYRCSQALYVMAKLGIADLSGDGAKSPGESAEATKTRPAGLRRLLRMLAALGVFVSAASPLSPRRLARDPEPLGRRRKPPI